MCCWPYTQYELEDPQPAKPKAKSKTAKPDYMMVSSRPHLQPVTIPGQMHMPGLYYSPPMVPYAPTGPTLNTTSAIPNAATAVTPMAEDAIFREFAAVGTLYWCREMPDGAWVQRDVNHIMRNLQPGRWEFNEHSGRPQFLQAPF